MAFCKQCGADLNGANFCASCGTPADGVAAVQQAVPVADPRQASLAEMEKMINYFGAKADVYTAFDAASAEVTTLSQRTFAGWIVAAVISLLIGIFSGAPFFYIIIAPFIALYIVQRKKNKEKLEDATVRLGELTAELEALYAGYGYCPIGQEYTKPELLREIYEVIRKGRASSVGDAINLYLKDIESAEMLRLQAEATEAAKETAKHTKSVARTSRKAAIYSGANFFFKK